MINERSVTYRSSSSGLTSEIYLLKSIGSVVFSLTFSSRIFVEFSVKLVYSTMVWQYFQIFCVQVYVILSRTNFRGNLHYSCLNELLARSRHHIWSLSDSNGIRTHNHLVLKQTLNHLVKLAECELSIKSRCCGIQITGKCTRESKKFKVDFFTHSPLPLFQAELTPVSSHLVINKIK